MIKEKSLSQTLRAQLVLREAILRGDFTPGERLSELSLVEAYKISRTPIRAALMHLSTEGFLEALPGGGFAVRGFSVGEINDAIELRGVLEGTAARFAAERGVSKPRLSEMELINQRIAALLVNEPTPASFSSYVKENAAFHHCLHQLAGSKSLISQLDTINALPFASPSAFILAQSRVAGSWLVLQQANYQHEAVIEAIAKRQGARAEAIMREHAHIAIHNLEQALKNNDVLAMVPGAVLIEQ